MRVFAGGCCIAATALLATLALQSPLMLWLRGGLAIIGFVLLSNAALREPHS
jgi:hypothetical protein